MKEREEEKGEGGEALTDEAADTCSLSLSHSLPHYHKWALGQEDLFPPLSPSPPPPVRAWQPPSPLPPPLFEWTSRCSCAFPANNDPSLLRTWNTKKC